MKESAKKFIILVNKYKNILIYIKGSPDPDAIASSYALSLIFKKFGVNASIVATTVLSLDQNKEFVKELRIPISIEKSLGNIDEYDSYIILDHQSAFAENITNKIPCFIHIDHHEIVEEDIKIDLQIIDTEAGSTCTIIALLLKELNLDFEEAVLTDMATALLFGIQIDTDKYYHAGKLDFEALNYLSRFSDSRIIDKLSGIPFSQMTSKLLGSALENQYLYKDWLICGIGFVDESERDTIAVIADFLLKRRDISTIVVFAAIMKDDNRLFLDASFRTENENIDLNSIIKEITYEGGGRKFKGAFQINLDYFSYCPDKDLLWNVLKITTIEVLIERREKMYVTEIKSFYDRLKRKISHLISK